MTVVPFRTICDCAKTEETISESLSSREEIRFSLIFRTVTAHVTCALLQKAQANVMLEPLEKIQELKKVTSFGRPWNSARCTWHWQS